jgi:hypothetical protein
LLKRAWSITTADTTAAAGSQGDGGRWTLGDVGELFSRKQKNYLNTSPFLVFLYLSADARSLQARPIPVSDRFQVLVTFKQE